MIKKRIESKSPAAFCLGLVAALGAAGCSDEDGNDDVIPETSYMTDPTTDPDVGDTTSEQPVSVAYTLAPVETEETTTTVCSKGSSTSRWTLVPA